MSDGLMPAIGRMHHPRSWEPRGFPSKGAASWFRGPFYGVAQRLYRRARPSMVLLMRIDRWDPRRDGPLSEDALLQKYSSHGFKLVRRVYPPGTLIGAQAYDVDKVDAVLSGLLKITIEGESAILGAGDAAYIPRGTLRRAEVVGSSAVICLESA